MARKGRSIHVDGIQHGAPIPFGARVGNMIFSSGILGADPATGKVPEDLESQCEFAFANMKTMVENAGGDISGIGKIMVYMKDRTQRDAVNKPWLAMFPDENDRPARHAIEYHAFPPGVLVQLEIIAVVE
jgi:2-iminobutanoate/2-iminopropanoate deaminase